MAWDLFCPHSQILPSWKAENGLIMQNTSQVRRIISRYPVLGCNFESRIKINVKGKGKGKGKGKDKNKGKGTITLHHRTKSWEKAAASMESVEGRIPGDQN